MQFRALTILCLVFSAQVFAVRELTGLTSKSLLQNGPNTAIVDVDVTAVDGEIIVQAEAFSTSSAQNAFAQAIAGDIDQIENSGGDAIALATASARAYAVAIARAFAAASVQIVSTATGGRACGQASADAFASARASAQAFVDVLAQASNDIDFASASAAVDAISTVTVTAFARAQADACVDGVGQASVAASLLTETIGIAYVEVCALALALVTPGAALAQIVVTAESGRVVATTFDGRFARDVVGGGSGGGSLVGVGTGGP